MKYFNVALFLVIYFSVVSCFKSYINKIELSKKYFAKKQVQKPLFAVSKKDELSDKNKNNKKSFGLTNLIQLVAMGAGAPMLGEYKETDESGRMIFELEANNLTDKDGNSKQMQAKFFNDGYVGNDFENEPPKFWANLISGGKLQEEWDQKQEEIRSKKLTNKKK